MSIAKAISQGYIKGQGHIKNIIQIIYFRFNLCRLHRRFGVYGNINIFFFERLRPWARWIIFFVSKGAIVTFLQFEKIMCAWKSQGLENVGSESTLHWRHNDHDSVSNHQPHGCLLNRLFRRISKKSSKLHVTGLCVGNSPGPVNSPHKGPVARKMFPFDEVIM